MICGRNWSIKRKDPTRTKPCRVIFSVGDTHTEYQQQKICQAKKHKRIVIMKKQK